MHPPDREGSRSVVYKALHTTTRQNVGAGIKMFCIVLTFILLTFSTFTFGQNNLIVSGATWTDTSGSTIQAHGAGILKVMYTNLLRVPICAYVYVP